MNRTPYRRVTPARHSGGSHQHDNEAEMAVSRGETLIMQCIICGIIMVFVLIASMTDIAPAATLRSGFTQVLSGAETLDELITDIRQFGNRLDLDFVPPQIFTPDPTTNDPYEPAGLNPEQTHLPYTYYENTNPSHLSPSPAADNQVSNPTVPEPPVTPGLWD